jgi:hypothetical protein
MAKRKTHGRTASGKPITDELVKGLANKAEAGYDDAGLHPASGCLSQRSRSHGHATLLSAAAPVPRPCCRFPRETRAL